MVLYSTKLRFLAKFARAKPDLEQLCTGMETTPNEGGGGKLREGRGTRKGIEGEDGRKGGSRRVGAIDSGCVHRYGEMGKASSFLLIDPHKTLAFIRPGSVSSNEVRDNAECGGVSPGKDLCRYLLASRSSLRL